MKKIISVFAVVAVIVITYLWLSAPRKLLEGEIVQTDSIEVSNKTNNLHEVVYPQSFSSLPRLKLKLSKGSGYLDVVEQRVDGFIIKTSNLGYSEAEGAYVEWTARGFINN
jgi:hypothetical protein